MGERQRALAGVAVTGAVDPDFWRDRRVLITGHTGFKGAWLTLWLTEMGARVTGLSDRIPTEPSLTHCARCEEGNVISWYRQLQAGADMRAVTVDQIAHLTGSPSRV